MLIDDEMRRRLSRAVPDIAAVLPQVFEMRALIERLSAQRRAADEQLAASLAGILNNPRERNV